MLITAVEALTFGVALILFRDRKSRDLQYLWEFLHLSQHPELQNQHNPQLIALISICTASMQIICMLIACARLNILESVSLRRIAHVEEFCDSDTRERKLNYYKDQSELDYGSFRNVF